MLNREDATHFARGLLMGSADIVPGVSGGTVALIVGIYTRLVTAISHFDLKTLGDLRRGRIGEAAAHVDLRFLIALGLGIATAILSLSSLIMMLLVDHRQHTYAAFFGMILGSSILVARLVPRWTAWRLVALVVASIGAFVFVGLPQLQNPPQFSPVYLYFCAVFAICAMILPGVSGSFLLLIMGAYTQVLELLHRLKGMLKGEMISANDFFCLAMFCIGMASGLIGFTKVLRWLLARHESITLAALTGFMLGSLRRLWPYQLDLTPTAVFERKEFQAQWPDFADASTWTSLLLIVGGCVLVVSLEAIAARRMKVAEAALEQEAMASDRVAV